MRASAPRNAKPRRRGKASITRLVALFALAAGTQALVPAQAAAMTAQESEACMHYGGKIVKTLTGSMICMREGSELYVSSGTPPPQPSQPLPQPPSPPPTPPSTSWQTALPHQTRHNGIRVNDPNRGFAQGGHTPTIGSKEERADRAKCLEIAWILKEIQVSMYLERRFPGLSWGRAFPGLSWEEARAGSEMDPATAIDPEEAIIRFKKHMLKSYENGESDSLKLGPNEYLEYVPRGSKDAKRLAELGLPVPDMSWYRGKREELKHDWGKMKCGDTFHQA